MADLSFLRQARPGKATLRVCLPNGTVAVVDGLDIETIAHRCPLLASAFESGSSGPSYSMEASSYALAVSFLRFLYEGDYIVRTEFYQEPCSLLTHAELFHIGDLYDIPDLRALAYINIIRDTEWSCSNPYPPGDLCAAIRFIYTHLQKERDLIDTIMQYCVSCFTYHKLGANKEFCQLIVDLLPFQRDLCRVNLVRNFEDEGAVDIICVALNSRVKSFHPFRSLAEQLAATDVSEDIFSLQSDAMSSCSGESRMSSPEPHYILVQRPRISSVGEEGAKTETSAPATEDFTLVHRPKDRSSKWKTAGEDWVDVFDSAEDTVSTSSFEAIDPIEDLMVLD